MDELERYKERLRITLEAEKICIFEVDLTRQLYTFFENAEAIFGVSGDTVLDEVRAFQYLQPEAYRLAVSEYFSHPEDEQVIETAFAQVLSGRPASYEARMKAGGSVFIWCRIHAIPLMENGKPARMIGIITNITDIKKKTEHLENAAHLDVFTGLYKKEHAINLISNVLQKDWMELHALIILDIDNFKNFNDTYGHADGDRILQTIAGQLKSTFRKSDITGRFGGDEFLILVRGVMDSQCLRCELHSLLRIELGDITCTNSIGVAFYPQDAAGFDDLFRKADMALYRAKVTKETVVFYGDKPAT